MIQVQAYANNQWDYPDFAYNKSIAFVDHLLPMPRVKFHLKSISYNSVFFFNTKKDLTFLAMKTFFTDW